MKFIAILFLAAFATLIGSASALPTSVVRPGKKSELAIIDRQKYQDDVESKLREIREKIETLKARAAKQGQAAQEEYDQQLPELKRKYDAAQRKFEKLKNASQDAWQDMKAGIDAAVSDLQAAYNRAALHFK